MIVLSSKEAADLLSILCTRLGFCLPPDAEARLIEQPPPDVRQFTAAVFIAEGLDPSTADRRIYRQVKTVVAEHFNGVTTASDLNQRPPRTPSTPP